MEQIVAIVTTRSVSCSSFGSKRFNRKVLKKVRCFHSLQIIFFVKNDIWTLQKSSLFGFWLMGLCWLSFFIISRKSYTAHSGNDLEELQFKKVEVVAIYFSKFIITMSSEAATGKCSMKNGVLKNFANFAKFLTTPVYRTPHNDCFCILIVKTSFFQIKKRI